MRLPICLVLTLVAAAGCNRVDPNMPDAEPPTPDGAACTTPAQCDDGDACTGVETCSGGSCQSGTPIVNTWYADCDSDGIAGVGGTVVMACLEPAPSSCGGGWTQTQPIAGSGDCNDTNALIYPGAPESCDGFDNDCDTAIDEDGASTFYQDADGDAYGNSAVSMVTCGTPSGYVSIGGDCNDSRNDIHPGAAETCDGLDNNCVMGVDEGLLVLQYRDADGDSFGNPGQSMTGCPAGGWVTNNGDCNDTAGAINPNAAEVCFNSVDDNCSASQDEVAQCTMDCNWGGAQWLSHGWNGGNAFNTGVWATCTGGKLAHMNWVNNVGTMVNPGATGTGDPIVGCGWTGNKWASQGYDGGNAWTFGANFTCSGGRVTGMSWGNNQLYPGQAPVNMPGQLACNWNGAVYLTNGYDNACGWYVGVNVTCSNGHITHVEAAQSMGCVPGP